MSFKPEISSVLIFNEALSMLPADPVQSEEEPSLEARECRRWYKGIVASLLERHHWNLATARETLAVIVNDRPAEWAYAYAKPNDMAYPVMIVPPNGAGYGGWLMQNYTYYLGGRALFMQAGGTIYSSVAIASLEFTTFNITEADFPTRFKDLVAENLAAKTCMAITKDAARERTLMSSFEFNAQRVIASDINRNRPTYGDRPTESELVRGAGIDLNYLGTGYALDPVANPANTGL